MYKNFIKPDIPKRYICKILLIMRLTTAILIVSMLQVSASSLAQKFTYVKKKTTLAILFKEMTKQTGYNVAWNEKKVNVETVIDADFRDASIEDALGRALSSLPLSYSISDKTVVIEEKKASLRDKVIDFFTAIDVRGRVVDEQGLPLVGAVVKVKGTKQVTTTNTNGEFVLNGVDEKGVLVISFLGYETQEIGASNNIGTIKFVQSSDKLEEVEINAGYYTVTDRERTGNISRITAREIEKQPVLNPLQALQNRVPGLQITQLTGVPAGGFKVQIRGRNSLNKEVGNDPLYIVDGIIFPSVQISSGVSNGITAGVNPLSMINPYDIKNIEVLKDADATAIYGSRGANGVILITTNKGGDGGPTITLSMNQSKSKVGRRISLLNTPKYLEMRREALRNDALQPRTTDYDINGAWEETKYTDWQKELIGNKANTTNISGNISGSNDKISFIIGVNHLNENTVFPGDLGFNRSTMHSSVSLGKPNNKINITFTNNYTYAKSKLLNFDPTQYILLPPNMPSSYDDYGNLNWSNNTVFNNPMALLLQTNNADVDNLMSNVSFNYRIFDKLVLRTSVGYNSIKRDELLKLPLSSYSPALGYGPVNRISNFSNNYNKSFIVEPQLSHEFKLGIGNLNSLIGFSFQENSSQIRTIRATTFNSDDLMDNIASAGALSTFELRYNQYRYSAIFARLNYIINGRYILNLTGRRDGSSKFGPGKQFANFGAIGAAWIFSDEKIFKDNFTFLSFGKLRFSYGITGNDQISDYGYLELWSNILFNGTYQGMSTLMPSRISNPDFAWENTYKKEVALVFSLFKSRINIEVSYYNNNSSNQLVGNPLPPSTGFTTIQSNLPAKVQNTGWEFECNFNILEKTKVKWSITSNLTLPKNMLISFPGLKGSNYAFDYIVGQPLSIRIINNLKGVNPETGLYDIEDTDENGQINLYDRFLHKNIGQRYYGGVQNSISYKQFNLNFLIGFTRQSGYNYLAGIPNTPGYFVRTNPLNNQLIEVLDRWKEIGDVSKVQKFTTTSSGRLSYLNARADSGLSIDDASYIRLKNINFTYALPEMITSLLKLNQAELSLQGQNIFTLTNYKGLDPENQSMVNLPPLKTILVGLKLTF